MNRHERRKAEKALKKRGSARNDLESIDRAEPSPELRMVFKGEGNLQLTPELINELIEEKGLKREDLEQFAAMGAQYCPSRNSFTTPSEDF